MVEKRDENLYYTEQNWLQGHTKEKPCKLLAKHGSHCDQERAEITDFLSKKDLVSAVLFIYSRGTNVTAPDGASAEKQQHESSGRSVAEEITLHPHSKPLVTEATLSPLFPSLPSY